jgi:GT2 family glycosyltransferase
MNQPLYNAIGPSVSAVIVLYKCSPSACLTLTSLVNARLYSGHKMPILLVDNTPDFDSTLQLPPDTTYLPCPDNLGLAHAYNRAIELAERGGYTWILTLDQDTNLAADFLEKLEHILRRVDHDPLIAALVPQVVANGSIVSPHFFLYGGLPRYPPAGYQGIPEERIYAFNSASLLRVEALRQARGYDPYFWLDCSDIQMFHSLGALGKRVYVDGNIQVQHDFSMMNIAESVSSWRYRHILLAEGAFWARHMNWLAAQQRIFGLVKRLAKHILNNESAELRRITLHFLGIKLFRSRAYQIELFKHSVEEHLGRKFRDTALAPRPPKISVCMAAYNGGRFVRDQLLSIMPQLSDRDEVVIVDDLSTDDTVEQILAFADPRIRLIRHESNQGVIATFDEAIRIATGDIIFLSDNDDVWRSDKVKRFMEEFQRDQAVMVVTSSLSLIDEDNRPFEDSRLTRDGKFKAGFFRNILKNSYQGSAMAFRSSLIPTILPLPQGRGFLHDAWIGTANDRTGGKTAFIPEALLLYRRHGRNFSGRLGFWQRLRSRSWLLIEHLRRHYC